MKKFWKKVRKGSPSRTGDASPKSGSLRGSVASLNIGYEVKEKDLGKLHKAAWVGDLSKVKQLAKKDPSPLDKENRTPLHLACVQGNEHIVQELLEWKAKANIGDNFCRTPLMRAVEFQQEGCVHLLLSYRVDVETVDSHGNTGLHLSVHGDNLNIIYMLIKAGSSLDRRNKDGYSSLHLAVKNKYEDICRLLLKEGADVNVEDTNLRTPLMYACQDGSIALVKLLLEYRADTVHKDSKGWSADDCAVIQGHHACSQLISDHLAKANRGTPASTPRSSLPPSVVNTPRDKDSIGLPMQDGQGDDSDNEPNSRASGGHGSDSWADSPEVSISDPRKAGKDEETDVEEDDGLFNDKPNTKINLSQFTKNIHISESDTDGESVRGSSLKRKTSTGSKGSESEGEHGTTNGVGRQTSWQAQTSGEENSWNDSPTTPRKNSSQRVSFKRDEELSEIHDITVTESEAESETGMQGATKKPLTTFGYVPSANGKNNNSQSSISAEKMKGINSNKKPALMDDLGINDDIDDISEMTDEDISDGPKIPSLPALPTVSHKNESDWDASAMSDIMTTPRPGILKKSSNAGLEDSQEEKNLQQMREEKQQEVNKPKMLIKAPVVESDDESSAWDTTEADNIHLPMDGSPVKVHSVLREQKSSVSEWDSDVEDMIQPLGSLGLQQTPTPPVPTLTGTVPKEVEAIVRQKQVECQDFDEVEAMSPVGGVEKSDTPIGDNEAAAKFYMSSSGSEGSFNEKNNNKKDKQNEDDDDDWDSTVGALTPRQNAGLQYKQVNIGDPDSVSEPVGVKSAQKAPMSQGTAVATEVDKDDDDSESSWDSEDDAMPSENIGPTNTIAFLTGVTTTDSTDGIEEDKDEKDGKGEKEDESDEDTETISSWEIERKTKRQNISFDSTALPRQREVVEEEVYRQEQLELEAQLAGQQARKEQLRIEQLEREEREIRQREREEQERRDREERERRDREETERREREEKVGREREEQERREREEQERREREEQERREREEQERREREEQERRDREETERREREEQERREWGRREREERDRKEMEELERREQEERERKEREQIILWEREDQLRREEEDKIRKELAENEKEEWGVDLTQNQYSPPDTVRHQQEELNRIDQQFQQERVRREEEEKRRKEEGELEKKETETFESRRLVQEEVIRRDNVSAVNAPSPRQAGSAGSSTTSPGAGVYVNIGSSTVEQIRQRLQVPAPTTNSPLMTSTGQFSVANDRFDDNDSLFSDNTGDDRLAYIPGLGSPNNLLDDDALSYTSTEFEDPVQSSAAYARDRDVLSNTNMTDPSSLLKVQEYVRDCRRQLEKEKNQRLVLENKVNLTGKEKTELTKKVENLTQQKSLLEQGKLDLEAKIRSLEYTLSDEEEKRKNAELLLNKTKEQLARKETTYVSELEAKQKAELTLRNVQIEMRSSVNTIKELEEEKEELHRQLNHAQNARSLQEQINDDQHKLIQQQQEQHQKQQQQHTPRDFDNLESSAEMAGEMDKLKAELYALKMEMDRQRSRFKDEIAITTTENEELINKVEDLRNDIKLNEEALAHATMQYNIQVTSLRTDIGNANALMDKEKAAKEKLEAEIDSLKTRLMAATHEMDKTVRARNEMEREHRREKELWTRDFDRKEQEGNMLKDNNQHLNQRLHSTESKLNSMESELHVSSTSLMERTAQMQQLKNDYERAAHNHSTVDQNARLEKEQNAKLQAKVENMQERLSQQQHENLSLRQQLDTMKVSGGGLPGNDANEKLNSILTNLRAESDRAKSSLEERNGSLVEQVARYKEELRSAESRRTSLEQDLRRLHEEHSDMVKKLSYSEATLQSALRTKEQLEQERAHLKTDMEKLQHRFQATHDKSIEAQARVSELVDRLEKAENSSTYSNQQLLNTSANMQAVAKSKNELDESMQQLQIENARLEAELKYEKQRADMLYQDLQDSQKVRNSLEALCANMKSSTAHLEEKLGIADLERNKNTTESRLSEVKSKSDMVNEERQVLESRLQAEIDKNQLLQKDVNTLKQHLKSAKHKIKSPRYSEFHPDVGNSEMFISTPRTQTQMVDPGGDIRNELEAKYRIELNRKLQDVNVFLDSQSHLRDKLDNSRTEVEAHLLADKRKLEEDVNSLRVKYEQAIAQKNMKDAEVKRFQELYESEMKWRMRISDQLTFSMDKGSVLKAKLSNERLHRNRLHNSIGNLNSTLLSNNSFDIGRVNGFHDDELSNKIKAELDRSIAKHLEAAPHDYNSPILRSSKEPNRFLSSLTQSSQDYIDVLKRKYYV